MHFSTKSYLKSTRNHTTKQALTNQFPTKYSYNLPYTSLINQILSLTLMHFLLLIHKHTHNLFTIYLIFHFNIVYIQFLILAFQIFILDHAREYIYFVHLTKLIFNALFYYYSLFKHFLLQVLTQTSTPHFLPHMTRPAGKVFYSNISIVFHHFLI